MSFPFIEQYSVLGVNPYLTLVCGLSSLLGFESLIGCEALGDYGLGIAKSLRTCSCVSLACNVVRFVRQRWYVFSISAIPVQSFVLYRQYCKAS